MRLPWVLDYASIEDARMRLGRLAIFDTDDPPTVEVSLDKLTESLNDIRIRVKERPNSWVGFAARLVEIVLANVDPDGIWDDAVEWVRDDFYRLWMKLAGAAP